MPNIVPIVLFFLLFLASLGMIACCVAELLSFNTQRNMVIATTLAGVSNMISLAWLSFYVVDMLVHSVPAGFISITVIVACYIAAFRFAIDKAHSRLQPPKELVDF